MKVITLSYKKKEDFSVRVPSSKSIMHRLLIAAALSEENSVIENAVYNADTLATMDCLSKMGAKIITEGSTVYVKGTCFKPASEVLDCGESGSTLRFLIPLVALSEKETVFEGHGRLMERPLSVYENLFADRNLRFELNGNRLCVSGPLTSGMYRVPGNVSSQFISGLLFALPFTHGNCELEVSEPFESASYVALTKTVLERFGIRIRQEGNRYFMSGDQKCHGLHTSVDCDDSLAGVFACIAAVSETKVYLEGIRKDSKQADHKIFEYLEKCGSVVTYDAYGVTVEGKKPRGCEMDLGDCPDLGPILFASAALGEGTFTFTHTERLRIKESDRIESMKEEMEKLGYELKEENGTVTIVSGKRKKKTGELLSSHHDHRILMALSILSTGEEAVSIEEPDCVSKSYPGFLQDLLKAGFTQINEFFHEDVI